MGQMTGYYNNNNNSSNRAPGTVPVLQVHQVRGGGGGVQHLQQQSPIIQQQRQTPPQGHSCCFVGCDMRRAVFIVNILSILIIDIGGWILFSIPSSNSVAGGMEEDNNNNDETTTIGSSLLPTFVIEEQPDWLFRTRMTLVVNFLMNVLSIHGAYKYQDWKLAIATAWYMLITLIPTIWAMLRFQEDSMTTTFLLLLLVGGIGWNGWCMIYPHGMLIRDIRQGIIKPETYIEQEQHWWL